MRLFAGIDGGQSATTALIADERGTLGRGRAGAADEVGQGPQSTRLRDALSAALTAALRDAGLPADSRFAAIVAGISGYEGRVYGVPPELPAESLTLLHDTPIAHAGALGGGPGVVVIAGTGSVAYASDGAGAQATIGGWGYLFGDEGSAFALTRRAVSEAMRMQDAGAQSGLTPLLLRFFNVPSLRRLARAFYAGTIDRTAFAACAVELLAAAQAGDPVATAYADEAAKALANIAGQAMAAVGMEQADVAVTGGMTQSPLLLERMEHWMKTLHAGARLVPPRYDAAAGALLLAYKAAGIAAPTL